MRANELGLGACLELRRVGEFLFDVADEACVGPNTARVTMAAVAVYAADRLTEGKTMTQQDVADAASAVVATVSGYSREVVGAYETRYGTPDVEDVPTDDWPSGLAGSSFCDRRPQSRPHPLRTRRSVLTPGALRAQLQPCGGQLCTRSGRSIRYPSSFRACLVAQYRMVLDEVKSVSRRQQCTLHRDA